MNAADAAHENQDRSAEGAKYDSQGASAKRVAPGTKNKKFDPALKRGVIRRQLFRPFRPYSQFLYSAPLALSGH
jgi:hypothetical protein